VQRVVLLDSPRLAQLQVGGEQEQEVFAGLPQRAPDLRLLQFHAVGNDGRGNLVWYHFSGHADDGGSDLLVPRRRGMATGPAVGGSTAATSAVDARQPYAIAVQLFMVWTLAT
jgi:hypothetical protein